MTSARTTILLADTSVCAHYDAAALNATDCLRIQRSPKLAERPDWQVSRYLKQQARQPVLSLTHSGGWAMLAEGLPEDGAVGIDMEQHKTRDIGAVLSWVADEAEQAWCFRQPEPLAAFYRLWTVKEALIKAANLRFPTDMKAVGLDVGNETPRLRSPGGGVWHGIGGTIGAFAFAVVHRHSGSVGWRFFGGANAAMVDVQVIW